MLDTDYKLMIALRLNAEDEELKKIVKIRKDIFAYSYKEDRFEMGNNDKDGKKNEKYEDKDGDKDVINGEVENDNNGNYQNDVNGVETDKLVDDGNDDKHQMGEQNNEHGRKDDISGDKGRDEEGMKRFVGDKSNYESEYQTESQEMQNDDLEDIVSLRESQEPTDLERIMKLPLLSIGISNATKSEELLKVENPTPSLHSLKLKIPRKSSGNYDAKKVVHVVDAVPVRSVAPIKYKPIEEIRKEKSVAARKSKAEVKKRATNQEPGKDKKVSTKEDTQKLKRGEKRGVKAMEEASNAIVSFYDRKVMIYKKWPETEMKLVEYIWSDRCDEG